MSLRMRHLLLVLVANVHVACSLAPSATVTGARNGLPPSLSNVRPAAGLSRAVLRLRDRASDAAEEGHFEECRELRVASAEQTLGHAKAMDEYVAASCATRGGDSAEALRLAKDALRLRPSLIRRMEHDDDLEPVRRSVEWSTVAADARAQSDGANNPRLVALYGEDQSDRKEAPRVDWKALERRDAVRRAEVDGILSANGARTADDFYYAAMILQHSTAPGSAARAHALCVRAIALDPSHDEAIWLASSSFDRLLLSEGKPQRFGTQIVNRDGTWRVWDVASDLTDDERAAWGVHSLADQRARAVEMNADR